MVLSIFMFTILVFHFRFSHTNPLHQGIFQSVVQFEGEVVAMTASLLGSKEKTSGGQICGNMTSGGTESILLAVKTSRDYMRAKRGITKPEMYVKSCNDIFNVFRSVVMISQLHLMLIYF